MQVNINEIRVADVPPEHLCTFTFSATDCMFVFSVFCNFSANFFLHSNRLGTLLNQRTVQWVPTAQCSLHKVSIKCSSGKSFFTILKSWLILAEGFARGVSSLLDGFSLSLKSLFLPLLCSFIWEEEGYTLDAQ